MRWVGRYRGLQRRVYRGSRGILALRLNGSVWRSRADIHSGVPDNRLSNSDLHTCVADSYALTGRQTYGDSRADIHSNTAVCYSFADAHRVSPNSHTHLYAISHLGTVYGHSFADA